ncbi:MAG: hypothetical protein IJG13_24400, partial [Kiritimatiellae bacterium]|nr:hypothetical protein [Kiritimatiellia bacterium]
VSEPPFLISMTTLCPPSPLARLTSSAFCPAPPLTEISPETVYIVPPRSYFVSLPLSIVPVSIADAGCAASSATSKVEKLKS